MNDISRCGIMKCYAIYLPESFRGAQVQSCALLATDSLGHHVSPSLTSTHRKHDFLVLSRPLILLWMESDFMDFYTIYWNIYKNIHTNILYKKLYEWFRDILFTLEIIVYYICEKIKIIKMNKKSCDWRLSKHYISF